IDAALLAAHESREQTTWLRPAPLRQALTALALATEQRNVFRLPASAPDSAALLPTSTARKAPLGKRVGTWFRGLAVKAAGSLRQLPVLSDVHIARANDYNEELVAILGKQFEHFRQQVPLKGKRVVLKPNLVE